MTLLAATAMIGVQQILDATQTTLERDLPAYIQELFDRTDLRLTFNNKVLQVPLFEIDALVAADALDLPSLAISSPGLAGPPTRNEGGLYDATWEVVVTAVSRAETAAETGQHARAWGLLIRSCLLANATLDGLGALSWVDESYAPLPAKNSRTLGGAISVFHVAVDNVAVQGRPRGTTATSTHLDVLAYGSTHPALVEGTP